MNDLTSRNYDKTLVTYVDVLGFAELLKKRSAAHVARLLGAMKENFAAGGRVHRNRKDEVVRIFKSFNFSDLIVRTTRIESGADVGETVDWELYYLSENQLFFALEGSLIRGAVCLDDLWTDPKESIVFGPALAKAYTLESQYAVYPRIVIDRDVIWEAEERGYAAKWQDFYSRGDDGAYFLDYLFGASLTGLEVGIPGDEPDARQRLGGHRDIILGFIKNQASLKDEPITQKIKQKWLWLALYHNSTIRRLKERLKHSPRGQHLDEFQIPEGLLKF